MIQTLRLQLSSVHLAPEPAVILFYSGSPGEEHRGLRRGQGSGRGLPQAIVPTHAHVDHAGAAAALRRLTGAPICLAAADWTTATRGENGPLRPRRASARPLPGWSRTGSRPSRPTSRPDALGQFGCPATCIATLIATPGHTAGSVSLVVPGGEAVAGDRLMGGHIGPISSDRLRDWSAQ